MPTTPTPIPPPPGRWNPYADPDDYIPLGGFTAMPWVIHSTNMATWVSKGTNTCDACAALSGRTYRLAYWQATVMPGWHHQCDCYLSLAKSWVRESPHDLWGTEPYWWNPLQSPIQYLADLFDRFLKFFSKKPGSGDRYSGFDVLNPVFGSNTGLTTAGWTLLNYTLRLKVYGMDGIAGSTRALLNIHKRIPSVQLPWEAPTTAETAPAWQYLSPQERHALGIL